MFEESREVHSASISGAQETVERQHVETDAACTSAEITWREGYDRESVERFLAECEAERARLLGAIAEQHERQRAAEQAAAAHREADQADFAAIVAAAHRELAEVEEEHKELVAAIRKAAVDEAARVLAAARAEAAAVRSMVGSVAVDLSAAEEPVRPAEADALSWHPGEARR